MKSYLLVLSVSVACAWVLCALLDSNGRTLRDPTGASVTPPPRPGVSSSRARELFLKNCAHCHGADARGDEGPDLHNLDRTEEQIRTRILNGKKGQMTAFAGKLSANDIQTLIGYLRTLK